VPRVGPDREQGLCDVGAAPRDLHDKAKHVAGAAAGTAVEGGHPKAEQSGVPKSSHRVVWELARPFGGGVGAAQVRDDVGKPGQPL
jgi:hypothetical protein